MCGIAGFTIAPDDYGKIDTQSMTMVLGYEMMTRGKDATGILTVDPKSRWKLRKKPYPADVFLASRSGIGCSASSLLLHTRAATQGKASIPGNNHPIQYGNVIGIHNGIIYNDDKLFDHHKWDRLNQVDSEAIFAALHHLPQNEALTNIDGGWAIAWINTDDDPRKLWLARGSSSPLFYATTQNGSVVFASTASAVKDAFEYGGITGTPDVKTAPEGFLAHTNPDDGGITILPEFDGSGKDAIGVRASKAYGYGQGGGHGYTHAGAGWDHDWYGTPDRNDDPTPFVRQQITGNKTFPKVGDRRKYINKRGEWIFEICSSVSPSCWAEIKESKVDQAHPKETASLTPPGTPLALPSGTTIVSSSTAGRHPIVVGGNSVLDDYGTDDMANGVVLPFDRMGGTVGRLDPDSLDEDDFIEKDDVRFGFAGIGDLVCIPKKHFSDGDGYGGIIGIVTDFDDVSKELLVEWRPGRLSLYSEYEVLIAAQKGR